MFTTVVKEKVEDFIYDHETGICMVIGASAVFGAWLIGVGQGYNLGLEIAREETKEKIDGILESFAEVGR